MADGDVKIRSKNGEFFTAYMAYPDALPAPAVIVLQEIFGVNDFIRGVVDMISAAGFIAIAPELYWRQRSDVQLNSDVDSDMAEAMALLTRLSEAEAIEDSKAAFAYVRTLPECTGKVGAMGYCLGGKLAYVMATRPDIDAAVAYYGTGIHHAPDIAANLRAPLMLHIAAEDFLCPPDAQKAIAERFDDVRDSLPGEIVVHVYDGATHGFTREGRSCYNKAAADLADSRTIAFLNQHLRG
jgi:carboxymethylenebutenolidase